MIGVILLIGATTTARAETFPIHLLGNHQGEVATLEFADAATLVSGGGDKTIRIWNVATGKELRSISLDRDVHVLSISPDGKHVAAAIGPTDKPPRIGVWEIASGKSVKQSPPLEKPSEYVQAIRYAPDGKSIAVVAGEATEIQLWTIATDELVTIDVGSEGVNERAVFTPDGRTLAVSMATARIHLISSADDGPDKPAGKPKLDSKPCGVYVYGLTIAHDGKSIVIGGQDRQAKQPVLEIRDLATWKVRDRFLGDVDRLQFAFMGTTYSPDDRLLATCATGAEFGVQLWDVAGKRRLARIENRLEIDGDRSSSGSSVVVFSPDGKLLATTHGERVVYWKVADLPQP